MSPRTRLRKGEDESPDPGLSLQKWQQLDKGIASKIRQMENLRWLLIHVDIEVFEAGMDLFESESALALWLCAPAQALNGKIPLRVMHTASGRQQVAHILRALTHRILQ